MRPVFVDNQDGNTLAQAITEHLGGLRKLDRAIEELWVASAYFNPQGLELLASETQHIPYIRLLLGAEPTAEAVLPKRKPGDPPEPAFTNKLISSALQKMETGMKTDRDLLPFDKATELAIRRLLEFLKSGRVEVRRYHGHFLHAKAYIFRGSDKGFIAGSSNLTLAGLRSNLELNLGHYNEPLIDKIEQWYKNLWQRALPFDLASIYEQLFADRDPYLIYLKTLWMLYGDELEQEIDESGHVPVTKFQQHGVVRAKRILRDCGGVLIADGVGLGKTFIAGDIVREYRERRQRVLLICPASLRDSIWDEFLNEYQLLAECVSYEQLANDHQLGGDMDHLKNDLEEYALVVIDEAHNYRNPDTRARASVLRRLLMGPRRDLLLLTATPVNNSLWDLYHLLRFFLKQDAHLADKGVLSIRGRFEDAMRVDPFNLSPDILYPIIDATTVKRTRQFVKKHYENDTIRNSDGKLVPIRFPKPVASSIKYALEKVLPGFFERLEEALMPPTGSPLLTMARYKPELYPAGQDTLDRDSALVGLLRSALLKRFESSVYAFCRTVKRMVEQNDIFLKGLEQGKVITKQFLRECAAADDEVEIEELLQASEETEDASLFNVERLRKDVRSDRQILQELLDQAVTVRAETCPKLKALIEELASVTEQAKSDAVDAEEEQQNRKVLVFSYFEDTIDWMERFLMKAIASDPRLACYRRRMASVAGSESRNGISRDEAIHGFAPISTKAPRARDQDRFDLLLSTDVLAEGMNLQQCRNIINYDLPWNPMRLVQRHGRIDRIGSPYQEVFLRTFFPDVQLNALLNLEERIRWKLAQAAASVGVETSPIEQGATGRQSFADTKEEIEKLLKDDPDLFEHGGTSSAAQSGEEYRQELREALETYGGQIAELPWKTGSGMVQGKQRGHFFCAAVGDRIYLRFVPFRSENEIITEIGTCLRLIECTKDTPKIMPFWVFESVYDAWDRARDNIYENWTFETDPINLQPKVRKLNREVAAFLREYSPKEVDEKKLNRALDCIEAPWSRREENLLRLAFNKEYDSPFERSRFLVEEVERIGVEPFQAPAPLPPIERDEIHLVCWLALESEGQAT